MKYIRSALISVLLLLAVAGSVLYMDRIIYFLKNARSLFVDVFDYEVSRERLVFLQLENEKLKGQLDLLKNENQEERYHYKGARVYSYYPYSNGSVIVVDAGLEDGIEKGMPVFLEGGALFGRVKEVSRTQSEIETIFSPAWRGSVAIGNEKSKAVLRGGSVPSLELISKEADVKSGDSVWNISQDFPMNAYIGTVGDINQPSQDVWRSGILKVPYTLEDVRFLWILIDFP